MPTARTAQPKDAEAAVLVLRRSISELCVVDHHNDRTTLEEWLKNKTVENFRTWLEARSSFCVVTELDDKVNGVGLVNRDGEIQLCYVTPEVQGQGFGSAILTALENKAKAWGLLKLHLESTVTARAFYEKHGYISLGTSKCGFGVSRCFPYEKSLQTNRTVEPDAKLPPI
jgi:GNAT superfamily N-acetyltransferase